MSFLAFLFISSTACEDRYQQGYDNGYEEGYEDGLQGYADEYEDGLRECNETAISSTYDSGYIAPSRHIITDLSGGSGVNFNGKHYPAGPTGGVRIYNDGTVEQY